ALSLWLKWDESATEAQCDLLRCIFGNPFHPSLPVLPKVLAWNGGTVQRIARSIYDDRAFDELPVLADALLHAGCDNEALVAHCKSEELHVKGCWAIDLILSKDG